MKNYDLDALKTCLLLARKTIIEMAAHEDKPWLQFSVTRAEIHQTGIYLRGTYKGETEERLLKRYQWEPKIWEQEKAAIDFLKENHPKGIMLHPAELLNCILIGPA